MRALFKRLTLMTAAILAAVILFLLFTAPRPALQFDDPLPDGLVSGAYHVHTTRSDGAGTVEQVAEAAAAAGLDFVILTDHGDATRTPDAPAYVFGVLMIDAVEVGTRGGHVVALGLDGPSPYPLGGRPQDVVEDIRRQGGFAVLAHPDSPDEGLRWRGSRQSWDGLEWLNADSEWRDESAGRLLTTVVRSFVRPSESVAAVFSRPARTLDRWDTAARGRAVVGLAAVDAHGGIGTDAGDRGGRRSFVGIPSYSAMFRTVVQMVDVGERLAGDPGADAAEVIGAIRRGATFSVVRALGGPAHLEFTASRASERAGMGERLPGEGGPVLLSATVPQAPGVQVSLLHDGRTVAGGSGRVEWTASAPGAYRVEVGFPGADVPWMVSNPIYVGDPAPIPAPDAIDVALDTVPLPADERWGIEADRTSEGRVAIEGGALAFDYRLGPGTPAGQYAALVAPVREEVGFDRLMFVASAAAPMRLSVQLRLPGGRDGLRWRQSVFVDAEPREVVVRLEDLEPVGGLSSQQPLVAPVQSVLFVVDTVNTRPGTSGRVTLRDVRFGVGNLGGPDGGR